MLVTPLFIGMWELVIIFCIALLLLGGKKIPELMKGLGQGVKSFKDGMSQIDEQINQAEKAVKSPEKKPEEKSAEDTKE